MLVAGLYLLGSADNPWSTIVFLFSLRIVESFRVWDAEPQLTLSLADYVLQIKFAFHLELSISWLSQNDHNQILDFLTKQLMLVNWKQSLNAALEKHISCHCENKVRYNLGNCKNKGKIIKTTISVTGRTWSSISDWKPNCHIGEMFSWTETSSVYNCLIL